LLDNTLIVWMGEFGRTPRINQQDGRDHWPLSFSVVLAGARIKGGQALGPTSAAGAPHKTKPPTPPPPFPTPFPSPGMEPARANRVNGVGIPLVEKGTKAVKEALC